METIDTKSSKRYDSYIYMNSKLPEIFIDADPTKIETICDYFIAKAAEDKNNIIRFNNNRSGEKHTTIMDTAMMMAYSTILNTLVQKDKYEKGITIAREYLKIDKM